MVALLRRPTAAGSKKRVRVLDDLEDELDGPSKTRAGKDSTKKFPGKAPMNPRQLMAAAMRSDSEEVRLMLSPSANRASLLVPVLEPALWQVQQHHTYITHKKLSECLMDARLHAEVPFSHRCTTNRV